jgi:serine/threonine-protein kinase
VTKKQEALAALLALAVWRCGGGGSPAGETSTPSPSPAGSTTTVFFPPGGAWYRDVSVAPLDGESGRVIAYLDRVGWGTGALRIDYSITVLEAGADTPALAFTPTEDFFSPDCDLDPVPVPPGGALEGEAGYECVGNGDCHLIVVQPSRARLFEMWRADIRNGSFRGGCLAVWDMTRVYPPSGRGEQCTSADAAGYPIAPLLFSADEVAGGAVEHAIRFILPNERIRAGVYVHPATHGTRATSGPADAPPYGTRLRLRAGYPLERLPNAGARVLARALQKHGMLLADGGQIALTARSDRFTRTKWQGLLGAQDLSVLAPRDFEMVDGGERVPVTNDCVRNP